MQKIQEQLIALGVELNQEKTKMVDVLKAESFGFLGFHLRRVRNRQRNEYYILMTPKMKACSTVKAKIRDIIRAGGSSPAKKIVANVNAVLVGWVNDFRVGNASDAFNEVRHYTGMKIRVLLTRRKLRQKRGIGWKRWSSESLHGVLGLYWDWKLHPLPNLEKFLQTSSP